jgi:tetratricopeptide (TPR) repeat protein
MGRVLLIFGWLSFVGFSIVLFPSLEARMEEFSPGDGKLYAGISIGVFALLAAFGQALLTDSLRVKSEDERSKMSPEQRKIHAKMQATAEVAKGNVKLAIVALENADMLAEAVELAQRHNEYGALARLFVRLGNKEKARKYAVLDANHLLAGHLSWALGDIAKGRGHYQKAAEALNPSAAPKEHARLWDRAGEPARALEFYKKANDLLHAGECLAMTGQVEVGRRMTEQAAVIAAYEKKQSGRSGPMAEGRGAAVRTVETLAETGDLLLAAEGFRDLEEWARAAQIFERIEHFYRAAVCYEKAGMSADFQRLSARQRAVPAPSHSQQSVDQFQSAPSHSAVAPPPGVPGPFRSGGMAQPPPLSALPAPTMAPAAKFIPVNEARYQGGLIPVVVSTGGARVSQEAVRKGNWQQVAVQLEEAGQFLGAADVQRQLGRLEDAALTLRKAQRPFEAAMMALGEANYNLAAELLVEDLERKIDPDVACLLGEMLVKLDQADLAWQVLRSHIAPVVKEENATIVYRYARIFESCGATTKAAELYKALIDSGANNPELNQRYQALLAAAPKQQPTSTRPRMKIRGMGAADFLARMLDDSNEAIPLPIAEATAPTVDRTVSTAPRPERQYPFTPPAVQFQLLPSKPEAAAEVAAPPTPMRQISLVGSTEAPTQPADPFAPAKRYELGKELGRGGMGVVYSAVDTMLDRPVAIKLLNSFDCGAEETRQFLLEARSVARLRHPNVITVYDIGLMDLRHYLAMEMVEGEDLRTKIAREGPLPVAEALRLFVALADGLRVVHEAGILHRDIKPANVLIHRDGSPRLVDFGLAKLQNPTSGNQEDNFKCAGTPGYMAPEQIQGAELGPACDIYALGITLFTMLAGQPPHRLRGLQGTTDIVHFTLGGKLPLVREYRQDVPDVLEMVYRYSTALEVGGRYQSVDAFLPVLKQWLAAMG